MSRALTKGSVALSVVVSLMACHPHVDLAAPDIHAPLVGRLEAYRRLGARGFQETYYYRNGVNMNFSADFVELGDGRRVYWPTDLIPLIDPNSPTAQAATEGESADRVSGILTGVALGILATGFVFLAADHESGPDVFLVSIVGTVGVGSAAAIYYVRAQRLRREAFRSYDAALRARLSLCVNGLELVSCPGPSSP